MVPYRRPGACALPPENSRTGSRLRDEGGLSLEHVDGLGEVDLEQPQDRLLEAQHRLRQAEVRVQRDLVPMHCSLFVP